MENPASAGFFLGHGVATPRTDDAALG